MSLCRGAFSLVIGTPEALFACATDTASDRWCSVFSVRIPVGQWVLGSESCGFDIIGAAFVDDVQPGELVTFLPGSDEPPKGRAGSSPPRVCVFEMIYFARPDSRFFGESLYSYRQRIGQILA